MKGLLYSRIGYEKKLPRHFVLRSDRKDSFPKQGEYQLKNTESKKVVFQGEFHFYGELWGDFWWLGDFTDFRESGNFFLELEDNKGQHEQSGAFKIEDKILWKETWDKCGRIQLRKRAYLENVNKGWQDCGSPLREANSHASLIFGLLDILEHKRSFLSEEEKSEVFHQIQHGCGYLADLQDMAKKAGFPPGTLIHEVKMQPPQYLHRDTALTALAFARLAEYAKDQELPLNRDYLERAILSFNWCLENPPKIGDGFYYPGHDTFHNLQISAQWPSRDLSILLSCAISLYLCGKHDFWKVIEELSWKLKKRQVHLDQMEDGLYGHFFEYVDVDFTEKAWNHHGVGSDTGATFPVELFPFLRLIKLFPESPLHAVWEELLRDYAYGYLRPACLRSPFCIMPLGVFKNQGLLWFAGLWHGMNAVYGLTAALALDLYRFYSDPDFYKIASGNLQWIAGVNAGLTTKNIASSFVSWTEVPEERALPVSMIHGCGDLFSGSWMNITGSICNGFAADTQFEFVNPPEKKYDGPFHFTDEDWITHTGGWLRALARL